MTTHIALLRAINVGGTNKVAMADLRDLAAALGLAEPRTLLQSGNLVFRSARHTTQQLESILEDHARTRLRLDTEFLVRTAAQWVKVISRNPFPDEAASDPSRLLVMFLKAAPGRASVHALQQAIKGREVARASGTELYVVYPDGIGRSRLTNIVIEKALGTRSTARNWNTVLKLAEMAGAS